MPFTKPNLAEFTCEVCGKVVLGRRGLYGHTLMVHGVKLENEQARVKRERDALNVKVVALEQELGSKVASLEQEVKKWKRYAIDDPGTCLSCGSMLIYGHDRQPLKLGDKDKSVGTVFVCRH